MVARLVKNSNADRGRSAPGGVFLSELGELAAAETHAVRVAPAELAHTDLVASDTEPFANELDRLSASLASVTPKRNPRTAKLLESSNRKVAQKVIEEAGEVALAAVKKNGRGIVRESADLLYHLAVLWRRAGIGPADIWAEMRHRADTLGIAEKLPKADA
jgi:phosphoribosyl-ATP pyrophosphohydrolase